MTTTINADTVVGGAVVTADASGQLGLQAAGVTKLTVSSSGVTLASALPIASGGTNATATPTAGAVPYGTGSAYAFTSAGTSGQVLTSNGASAPTWGSAPAPTAAQGASMVLVTSVTASSSSTVDVEDAMTDYDEYVILIDGVKPSNNASILEGLLKIGGSYITTSTYNSTWTTQYTATASVNTYQFSSYPRIQYTLGSVQNASTQNLNGAVWITRPSSTSVYPSLRYDFQFGTSSVNANAQYNYGFVNNSTTGSAVTGLRFSFDSGTISTGSFRLYGIKKS